MGGETYGWAAGCDAAWCCFCAGGVWLAEVLRQGRAGEGKEWRSVRCF